MRKPGFLLLLDRRIRAPSLLKSSVRPACNPVTSGWFSLDFSSLPPHLPPPPPRVSPAFRRVVIPSPVGGGGIDQAGLSCFFISAELTRELRTHNTHQESKSRQRRCFVIMREKPGQWFPSPQEARRPGLAGGARCQLERQANTERDGMTSRWRCFFLGGGVTPYARVAVGGLR